MGNCEHKDAKERSALLLEEGVVNDIAEFFRAAGNPTRLRILCYLLDGEACVSELSEQFSLSMSVLSQHLRNLRLQKIVGSRREGKHVYYFLIDHHVIEIVRMALEHAQEEDCSD